jgi:hypothetical protein
MMMSSLSSQPQENPNNVEWFDAVGILRPHVVRIATPRGTGTGFLVSSSDVSQICAIATAAHLVGAAHSWEEPIRITDHIGKSVLLHHMDRAIILEDSHDTAAILLMRGELNLPNEPRMLTPPGKHLLQGNEIGWLGFPAIPLAELCLFSGRISAWIESQHAYLVDGVVINGTSGGPAFWICGNTVGLIGVVSAYVPNRATGEALPGLCVIRGVEDYHRVASMVRSIDEAKEKETTPLVSDPDVKPPPSGNV